jgi:hypothetical protein
MKHRSNLDLEIDLGPALDTVATGRNFARGVDRMWPCLSVDRDQSALTTIVIVHHQIRSVIGRGHCGASKLAPVAARTE